MMTFFFQSHQLMSVWLLVASSRSSNTPCLWFKHVFPQEYVCDCTFLRLRATASLSSLSIVVLSFPGTQQSELLSRTQCREEDAGRVRSHITSVVAPRSVDKNHSMRQQAYHCVISAACRQQCTVNTSTTSALAIPYAG